MQESPPPAPRAFPDQMRHEIDEAISHGSISLLSLVLLHSHECNASHLVHEAVRQQHFGALEFLLRGGYAVDEMCCGHRPLHLAVQCCTVEGDAGYCMAKLLLEHGASPSPCENDDWSQPSPLRDAVLRGYTAAAALLLSHGADPNEVGPRGDTPLHVACCQLSLGSIPGSPLQLPFLQGYQEQIIGLLLRHGADPSQRDAVGMAPAMLVPKCAPQLRAKLVRAERWRNRRSMAQACAKLAGEQAHAGDARAACLSHGDVSGVVSSFL